MRPERLEKHLSQGAKLANANRLEPLVLFAATDNALLLSTACETAVAQMRPSIHDLCCVRNNFAFVIHVRACSTVCFAANPHCVSCVSSLRVHSLCCDVAMINERTGSPTTAILFLQGEAWPSRMLAGVRCFLKFTKACTEQTSLSTNIIVFPQLGSGSV